MPLLILEVLQLEVRRVELEARFGGGLLVRAHGGVGGAVEGLKAREEGVCVDGEEGGVGVELRRGG